MDGSGWLGVAEFLRTKRCSAMKRTGECGCPGKAKAACEAAERMALACEDADAGEEPSHPLSDIARFLVWKRCLEARGGGECGHRLCDEAGKHARFVEGRLPSVK